MSASKTEKAKFMIKKKVTHLDDSSGDESDHSFTGVADSTKTAGTTSNGKQASKAAAANTPAKKSSALSKTAPTKEPIKDTAQASTNAAAKKSQHTLESMSAIAAQYQEQNREFAVKFDFLKQELSLKDTKIAQLDHENFQLREYVIRLEEELKRIRDENIAIQNEYVELREELGQLREENEKLVAAASSRIERPVVSKLAAGSKTTPASVFRTPSRPGEDLNSMSILMTDNVNESVLNGEARSSDLTEAFFQMLPMMETMKTQFQTQFALFKSMYQHARPFISQHQLHLNRPSMLLNARKSLVNETLNVTAHQEGESTRSSLNDTQPNAVLTPESMRRLAENVRLQKEQMDKRAKAASEKQAAFERAAAVSQPAAAAKPVPQIVIDDESEEEEEDGDDSEMPEEIEGESEEEVEEEDEDDEEEEEEEEQASQEMDTSETEAFDICQVDDVKPVPEVAEDQAGLGVIEEETTKDVIEESVLGEEVQEIEEEPASSPDDHHEKRQSSEGHADQSQMTERRSLLVVKKNVTFDESGPTFSDPKSNKNYYLELENRPVRVNVEACATTSRTPGAIRTKPPIGKPVESKKPILKPQQAAPEPVSETGPAAGEHESAEGGFARKSLSNNRRSNCDRRRSRAFSIGTNNNENNPILNPDEMLNAGSAAAAQLIDETAMIIPMTQPEASADAAADEFEAALNQIGDRTEMDGGFQHGLSNSSLNAAKPKSIFKSKQQQQEAVSEVAVTKSTNSDELRHVPEQSQKAIADYLGEVGDEGKKKESKKKSTKVKEPEVESGAEQEAKAAKSKARKSSKPKTSAAEEAAVAQDTSDQSGAKQPKRTIDSLYENAGSAAPESSGAGYLAVPSAGASFDTFEGSNHSQSTEAGGLGASPMRNSQNLSSNSSNSLACSPASRSNVSEDGNDSSLSKKIKLSPDTLREQMNGEAGGRRRHKVVSYKEPSLNVKMRRDKENKVCIKTASSSSSSSSSKSQQQPA